MQGVLALGGSLTDWNDTELARAAELVAEYKTIRPLVQHGLQYRLTATPVTGVQYVAADGSATAILAYRLAAAYGERPRPLPLSRLDPDARYLDARSGQVHHGAVLLSRGLPLDLPADDHASTLIHLIRV
jgi:alpha-galactosidase